MTPDQIIADTRNSVDARIDHIEEETNYDLVCVQFQMEAVLWEAIKAGTLADVAAFMAWISPVPE